MLQEQAEHEDSAFVTLTYDEDYVPRIRADYSTFLQYTIHGHDGDQLQTVDRKDLQKYFKRLRKKIKFKYFACAEYGEQSGRPHYHMIIFGQPKCDCVPRNGSKIIEHSCIYQEKWPFGRIDVGSAEADSIRYVAQYIDKKISLVDDPEPYHGREQESQYNSNGIGKGYLEKNASKLARDLTDKHRQIPVGLSRYYIKNIGKYLTEDELDIFIYRMKEKGLKNELDRIRDLTGGYDLSVDEISPAQYAELLYTRGSEYNAFLVRRAEHYRDMRLVKSKKKTRI